MKMKRIAAALAAALLLTAAACGSDAGRDGTASVNSGVPEGKGSGNIVTTRPVGELPEVTELTLEQKASQMLLPACYNITPAMMKQNCYGGTLSKPWTFTSAEWRDYIGDFQEAAVTSEAGIPLIFGQDDVHGVNYALNTVIFPHNIGMGAANDEELMYQVGLITADEAKLCHMLWNYSPVVAQSADPRWGRTYESYGSDLEIIKRLGTAYTRGLVDGGLVACPKHFLADGNVAYGTGEASDVYRLIDRGDAELSDPEIDALLDVYRAEIEAGAQTIMISHSSLNGVKMHENKKYIDILKNDMGFEGFIVSDWNSVQNTSPTSYYDQMVASVNAGIDLFMEVDRFEEAKNIIVEAVNNGDIPEERVDDAVRRILKVKADAGIFDDPFCEKLETKQSETGSAEYRAVAEKAVEESLVLVKNEGEALPFKEGMSIYITGPAAQNDPAQCGGWTIDWNESAMEDIPGVTSILEGFLQKAPEYGINIITDKSEAENADVVLLVVGEQSYAEWNGDTPDLQLCGMLGLEGNKEAIAEAEKLDKPVVACIIAGRNVIISDHYDDWDAVVMCYLPGSEGQGVADVLCGGENFRGKLPSPWYDSIEGLEAGKPWLQQGYGLTY